MLGEIAADGHACAAKGADEVATIGELAQLHLLAEAQIPEAVACRAGETTDTDVTVQPHFVQSDGTFRRAVWCLDCCHLEESN